MYSYELFLCFFKITWQHMLGISAREPTVKSSKAGMYAGEDFLSLKYASS